MLKLIKKIQCKILEHDWEITHLADHYYGVLNAARYEIATCKRCGALEEAREIKGIMCKQFGHKWTEEIHNCVRFKECMRCRLKLAEGC